MQEQIKSKPKSLVSNSFWSMSLTIWQIAVTFFLTPFLVKELGLEYYGILILLLSISGVMGILNFGLGDTTLRYVAYYYGKNDTQSINRIISNTFSIFTIISIISFCILFFFSENIVNLLINDVNENKILFIDLVQITAVTIAISFMGGAFGTVPQALQRYDISTKINIINSILYVVGTLVILFNHGSVKDLVLWNLINTIILQFMNMFVSKKLISTLSFLPKFDKETFREVFGFSFFTFLIHIFGIIHTNTDRVLTTSLINVSSLSYLSISQQLSTKGSQVIISIGNILLPKFTTITENDEKKELFLDSAWILLILSSIIFLPITVLMPDFLTLWINKDFSEKGSFLAQIITSSFIISGSFSSYASLFNGIGKAQYMTVVLILIGTFSLAINFILISQYGFNGLGYAYWITPVIGILAILFAWIKVLKQKKMLPLIKTYFIPSFVLFAYLLITLKIINFFVIDNWFYLILSIIIIIFFLLSILLYLEYVLNGKSNRLIKFLTIYKRLKK